MRFISEETVRTVENADIIGIIGEYTKLEMRSANDWWGCCPFHGEKTASFHVDGDKKFSVGEKYNEDAPVVITYHAFPQKSN